MKQLFSIAFLLLFGFIANAQEQTLEIVIDGKAQTVTTGKEYKYVNMKGDTITYFVRTQGSDAPKYAKTEFDKAEKVAVPKTQPEPEAPATPVTKAEPVKPAPKAEPAKVEPAKAPKTEAPETAQKGKIEKLPIGQSKKKVETTENTSALLGKAYRFDDLGFGEKELNETKKLSLVKVQDAVATAYPSLEFLPESNVAFCYNQPVVVYHGDEEEFKKLNTTMKVCKDGKWSENDNKLQVSLNLENRNKKLNYQINEIKGETLVMEKKASHIF